MAEDDHLSGEPVKQSQDLSVQFHLGRRKMDKQQMKPVRSSLRHPKGYRIGPSRAGGVHISSHKDRDRYSFKLLEEVSVPYVAGMEDERRTALLKNREEGGMGISVGVRKDRDPAAVDRRKVDGSVLVFLDHPLL